MGFAENLICDRLYRLALSKQQLSTLTRIRTQVLIPGLRGALKLTNQDLEKIYEVLDGAEKLKKFAEPFVLPTHVGQLHYLLEQQGTGRLDVLKSPVLDAIAVEISEL